MPEMTQALHDVVSSVASAPCFPAVIVMDRATLLPLLLLAVTGWQVMSQQAAADRERIATDAWADVIRHIDDTSASGEEEK